MTDEDMAPAQAADDLEELARLLDPHLSQAAKAGKSVRTDRWPALAAIAFILGTSLLIWALIFALIRYLL